MSEEAQYFRIGLFTIFAFLLLAALIIFFGGGKAFQKKIYLETYFDKSASGVDVGAPVRFRGVNIGKVSNISFVFNEYPSEQRSSIYNYVILELEITKPVFPGMFEKPDIGKYIQAAVDQGLRARIEPLGITGLNYIELDFLNPSESPALKISWTPRNYYVPSAPGQLESILTSVNKIMRDVEKLQLSDMGEQTLALLRRLNSTIEEAKLGEISEEIQTLAANANQLITEIRTTLSEIDFSVLSADARKALSAASDAATDLQRILNNVEPSFQFGKDDIPVTLANLRKITENLRVLSEDLRTNPSRLLFSKPPKKTNLFQPERPHQGRVLVSP